MGLDQIVNVTVVVQNPGITEAGFGVPLIVSHSASWVERTRTYTDIDGVGDDFAVNSPEYMAAAKVFGQTPSPPILMIGRAINVPTQKFSVAARTVANSTEYKLRVAAKSGLTWVSQTATYTSDSSATNDEIVTGLKTAIDALAAPVVSGVGASQFTTSLQGSVGSKTLQILANTAGDFYGLQVTDINKLSQAQTEADPGIATDLAAIIDESSVWYGIITLFNSSAIVLAAAAWVETETKLYIMATMDSLVATQADGVGTDVAQSLAGFSYTRTGPFLHPANDEFADAAEIGRFFPVNPGADNWRLKPLAGVSPVAYTATHVTNMEAKSCNYYYNLSGVNVVGGNGKVSSGQYIDVIRGIDWWTARVQARIVNMLIDLDKVPYDDDGIILVQNQIEAQNKEGISQGLIAPNPAPTVTVPLAQDVSSTDKENRVLNNVTTDWTLAGAINKVNVRAQISF